MVPVGLLSGCLGEPETDRFSSEKLMSEVGSGPGGRWFKSTRPDHFSAVYSERRGDTLFPSGVVTLSVRHPGIKALIVTGHGNILDEEAPDWWTREAHLTKPFDATTLKKTVADLIDRTSPRAVGAHSAARLPKNPQKCAAVAAASSRLWQGSAMTAPTSVTI